MGLLRPIAADDVADVLAEVAYANPRNGITEIADPERGPFNQIIARYLEAPGDSRKVVSDPKARYFGGQLEEESLVPVGERVSAGSVLMSGYAQGPVTATAGGHLELASLGTLSVQRRAHMQALDQAAARDHREHLALDCRSGALGSIPTRDPRRGKGADMSAMVTDQSAVVRDPANVWLILLGI